jgi:hypothetical protein
VAISLVNYSGGEMSGHFEVVNYSGSRMGGYINIVVAENGDQKSSWSS